jgi:hypothetical protein
MSSITDQATGTIIKSDRSGRTRYTPQYKQEVLAAFKSSSLSAPTFAAQCGIKYPTFAHAAFWLRYLARLSLLEGFSGPDR